MYEIPLCSTSPVILVVCGVDRVLAENFSQESLKAQKRNTIKPFIKNIKDVLEINDNLYETFF